jgi:exodeoxyribonuclease VII large subunit
LSVDRLPTYSVAELNTAIGSLLERGFAPRFLLEATVSRPQLKKGHLWLTLTDGSASISGVVWASKLAQLSYQPKDGDGVTVVGKLNFWAARASLTVQALDIRPSLGTVLRDFERVRQLLEQQGVIDPSRQRPLPSQPSAIAVLTSVPSSALADMLRTAAERWPLTQLIVVPIPVQGSVAPTIISTLENLAERSIELGLQALVLARGGGSREDLAVFDNEVLCRLLADYPIPVVTGLGHEDDLTVADLVADHRAATPTAAIVALLPDREAERQALVQRQSRLRDALLGRIHRERQRLQDRTVALQQQSPLEKIRRLRQELAQKHQLLKALSPERWLKRGLALISNEAGESISGLESVKIGDQLNIRMSDGSLEARVDQIQRSEPNTTS